MKNILFCISETIKSILEMYRHFSDEYLVKSNDENLKYLLKTNKDKIILEKTVDTLLKNCYGKPIEITLNGKRVSVSI